MAGTATDTGLRRTVTDKDANATTYGYDALDRLVVSPFANGSPGATGRISPRPPPPAAGGVR
jgi:YD repeat-containing protein